ncbi:OmpA family protein [Paludibacter jiangxiensis]|uniref:OmpA family protein n=1 Tax=Paludibacter jiangxiensis TaxID=681398 RepID=A0A161LG97_9BACT|nr:OmpA family protein [Paludibacter jiangxiensis]GAT63867.1 OmpA family protein [Paludibacter jiangxiensis]
MKKIITCGLLLFAFIAVANAQADKKADAKDAKATFQPGWYMSLYTGYNLFLGEGSNIFKSGNSINFRNDGGVLSTFGLGYDFNPVIGLRGELGWARHGWQGYNAYTKVNNPDWWSVNFTGDLTVNLSNWWGGYNPDRIFDVTAFGGIGLGVRSANQVAAKKQLTPIVRAGLLGSFHLSKQFDLNAEVATNAVRDGFNGVKAGLFFDDFTAFQVGFTYHFKATSKAAPTPAPEPVIQIKEVVKHDTVFVKVPAPKVTKTVTKEFSKEIFFGFDNSSLNDLNKKATIEETVAFLKANPDAKLTVDGYADKNSGSKAYNLKLSKKRAQAVAKAITKAGVDKSRLTVVGHGVIPQLYKEKAKNRLTTLKSSYQVVEVQ